MLSCFVHIYNNCNWFRRFRSRIISSENSTGIVGQVDCACCSRFLKNRCVIGRVPTWLLGAPVAQEMILVGRRLLLDKKTRGTHVRAHAKTWHAGRCFRHWTCRNSLMELGSVVVRAWRFGYFVGFCGTWLFVETSRHRHYESRFQVLRIMRNSFFWEQATVWGNRGKTTRRC